MVNPLVDMIRKPLIAGSLVLGSVFSGGLTDLVVPSNEANADEIVFPGGSGIDTALTKDKRPIRNKEVYQGRLRAKIGPLEIKSEGDFTIYRNDGEGNIFNPRNPVPYVSLGHENNCYKVTIGAPKGREISVTFNKGNRYGGLDPRGFDKNGRPFNLPINVSVKDNSAITIDDKSEFGNVPSIRAVGPFTIQTGNLKVIGNGKNVKGYNSKDPGASVPFRLISYEYGQKKFRGNKIYFADCFGEFNRTRLTQKLLGGPNGGKKIFIISGRGGEDPDIYFPSKEFAADRNKHRFWRKSSERQEEIYFNKEYGSRK